jgi:tetratricopeptide (TPR) repeat protein
VFTTYSENPVIGMTNLGTLERLLLTLRQAGLLGICLALSAVPGISAADEESEEVADHILAAEEALNDNRYKDAATRYRQAAELSESVEVAKTATRVAYSYGFNDEAILSALRWSELDPDDNEALLYVAQLYLRAGEIRESRKTFETLLSKSEEPMDEQLMRLIPVLAREDSAYAYELMRQLARPYRDSPYAHYAVAVLALDADELDEAAKRAKRAVELDPEWIRPHLVYARSLLLAGDEDAAIDYTARLIGDDPDPDPEARLELAIMLVSAGRDDDALSQVNQVLLEQPYRTDALRLMAIINFRLERLDAAKSDFEDLLASGNYRMDALYYLGRIADRREELDDAVRYYIEVTSGSNAILAQSRAAGILAQQGESEKALENLNRFAEINPNYAVDMLRTRAQVLASLERYEEALDAFDKAVGYRPDEEGLYLSRAELLLRMDRVPEAIGQYRMAARRWPDSAMSLNALGYTLADRTDHYDEAARLIRKALRMEPESAAIIDSWGWVLHKQGKNDEALEYLEKAYDKLRDPEVAAHIVEVLWALDRRDEAATALEDAELLFPDSELLQIVRDRLMPEAP